MTGAPASAGFCGRPGLVVTAAGELSITAGDDGLARGTGDLSRGTGVWLHGADAAAHGFHGGEDFGEVVGRLRRGEVRAVSTVLTRSNLRTLVALAELVVELRVVAWRVVVAGGAVVDGVTPRLAVALPHALQAITVASRRGVAGWIAGAPHCLLGPFRGASLVVEPRAFAAKCDGCAARAQCPGVEAAYLKRFGDEEVSPRALRGASAAPRAGREMFGA